MWYYIFSDRCTLATDKPQPQHSHMSVSHLLTLLWHTLYIIYIISQLSSGWVQVRASVGAVHNESWSQPTVCLYMPDIIFFVLPLPHKKTSGVLFRTNIHRPTTNIQTALFHPHSLCYISACFSLSAVEFHLHRCWVMAVQRGKDC